MADDQTTKEQQAAWIGAHMGQSYTQAFNIRQVMYRIQDVDLPFKRGIRVEQFLMFLGAFVVTVIVNGLIIYPLMGIFGVHLAPQIALVLWIAFPIFMAIRIGKPMPYNKTITGTAASFLRYNLDDKWHCRGLPVDKAPKTGLEGNYARLWTVDPLYAGVESPDDKPATEFLVYTNQDFPDTIVRLPDEFVEKRGIIEDEESFYERILPTSSIGRVKQMNSDHSDIITTESLLDVAPVFLRNHKSEDELANA